MHGIQGMGLFGSLLLAGLRPWFSGPVKGGRFVGTGAGEVLEFLLQVRQIPLYYFPNDTQVHLEIIVYQDMAHALDGIPGELGIFFGNRRGFCKPPRPKFGGGEVYRPGPTRSGQTRRGHVTRISRYGGWPPTYPEGAPADFSQWNGFL